MRLRTNAERDTIRSSTVRHKWWVEIENADRTFIDLTAWLESGEYGESIDQPVGTFSISFRRANATGSLAPTIGASPLNRNNAGAYAELLAPGRNLRIYTAAADPGVDLTTKKKLSFIGRVDAVNWTQSPIVVTGRDLGGWIVDKYINQERLYAAPGPEAMENIIRDLLIDNPPFGAPTIYTPTSPGFFFSNMKGALQPRKSLMEAIQQDYALMIGWVARYRFDATDTNRFTLFDVNRAKTISDDTFGPGEYKDITRIEVSDAEVRNYIVGKFYDNKGQARSRTAQNVTSQSKYGVKFMEIQLANGDPIDTDAEMDTMLAAAVHDLSSPLTTQEMETLFYWPVQLGDLYTFQQNSAHYDSDQQLAVTGYSHRYANGEAVTAMQCRGTVVGAYHAWSRVGGSTATLDVPPTVGSVDISYPIAGQVQVSVKGGLSVGSWRIAVSTAGPPTLAAVQAAAVFTGQNVDAAISATVYAGQVLYVGVLAYTGVLGTGAESALFSKNEARASLGAAGKPSGFFKFINQTAINVTVQLNGALGQAAAGPLEYRYRWNDTDGTPGTFSAWVSAPALPQSVVVDRRPMATTILDFELRQADGSVTPLALSIPGTMQALDLPTGKLVRSIPSTDGNYNGTAMDVGGQVMHPQLKLSGFPTRGFDHIMAPALETGAAGHNLITNPGFELAPSATGLDGVALGWDVLQTNGGDWAAAREVFPLAAKSGQAILKLTVNAGTRAGGTYFAAVPHRTKFRVLPGETYTIAAWFTAQQSVAIPAGITCSGTLFLRVFFTDGTSVDVVGPSITAISAVMTRYASTVTIPTTKAVDYALLFVEGLYSNSSSGQVVSGIMWDLRVDQVELIRVLKSDDELADGTTYRRLPQAVIPATDNLLRSGVHTSASLASRIAAEVVSKRGAYFIETFDALPSSTGWNVAGSLSQVADASTMGGKALVSSGFTNMSFAYPSPFNPKKLYRMRARVRTDTYNTGPASHSLFYVGVIGQDQAGAPTNTNGGAMYICAEGYDAVASFGGGVWGEYVGWFKGASQAFGVTSLGVSTSAKAPSALNVNTVAIRPYVLMGYDGVGGVAGSGGGTFLIDYVLIDEFDEDGSFRTYNAQNVNGDLFSSVTQLDGTQNRALTKGTQIRDYAHADTVVFSPAFAAPPSLTFVPILGSVVYQPSAGSWAGGAGFDATKSQGFDLDIPSVSGTGGTLRAQLRQTGGTTANNNDFTGGNLTTAGQGSTAGALASAPSTSNHYTVRYKGSITVTYSGPFSPPGSRTLSVVVQINRRAGGSGGASTELARRTYTATADTSNSSVTLSIDESLDVLSAAIGSTDFIEVKILTVTSTGGAGTSSLSIHGYTTGGDGAAGVSYLTGAADATTTMTPSSAKAIRLIATGYQ